MEATAIIYFVPNIKPEELSHAHGEWYVREIGTWRWKKAPRIPRDYMVLRFKRGRFYVHRYAGFEYSYRWNYNG